MLNKFCPLEILLLTTSILTIVRIAWYFFSNLKKLVERVELSSETCLLVNSENTILQKSRQNLKLFQHSPMRASSYFRLKSKYYSQKYFSNVSYLSSSTLQVDRMARAAFSTNAGKESVRHCFGMTEVGNHFASETLTA